MKKENTAAIKIKVYLTESAVKDYLQKTNANFQAPLRPYKVWHENFLLTVEWIRQYCFEINEVAKGNFISASKYNRDVIKLEKIGYCGTRIYHYKGIPKYIFIDWFDFRNGGKFEKLYEHRPEYKSLKQYILEAYQEA